MKKRNTYQNQSQELLYLFEDAISNDKVMCVPMDYAKNDHLVMFCNGHGDILRKPFSVKNTPEGLAYKSRTLSTKAPYKNWRGYSERTHLSQCVQRCASQTDQESGDDVKGNPCF